MKETAVRVPGWIPSATNATDRDISPETAKKKWTDVTGVMALDISHETAIRTQRKALATHVGNQATSHGIVQNGNQVAVVATNPMCLATNVT
jgi:hypothetical protein